MLSNIKLFISRYLFRRKYRQAIRYLNLASRIRRRADDRDKIADAYEELGVLQVAHKHRRAASLLRGEAQLVQNRAKQLVPSGNLVPIRTASSGDERSEPSPVPSPNAAAATPKRRTETVADFQVKHKRSAVRIFGADSNAPSFGFRSLKPKKDADHRLSFSFDQINDIPGLICELAEYGLEHLQLDGHSRAQCEVFLEGYASYRRHHGVARSKQTHTPSMASEDDADLRRSKKRPVDTVNGSAR